MGLSPVLPALSCAILAAVLVTPTPDVEFVWDDRAAVVWSKDIRPETPWSDLLVHDFWGQNISLEYVGRFLPMFV
jgi:hypothetical protein